MKYLATLKKLPNSLLNIITMRIPLLVLFISFVICACQSPPKEGPTKIPIKIVVVSMFEPGEDEGDQPGEFQNWVEKLPLQKTLSFPQGIEIYATIRS